MLTRMTEEDWATVLEVFRACRSRRGAKGRNDRLFLEAVHYFCAHNITWRALPAEYGSWNSVWKRFWRLSQAGVFEAFFDALAAMSQTAHLVQMFDSTVVRAHVSAAGAKGGQDGQALGRSRGGFSTKIHLKADLDGRPLAFHLTEGQAGDSPQFEVLLDLGPDITPRAAMGDKGRNDRRFLEALHYFTLHNINWRALPAEFGNWNSIWKRFWRLSRAGVFEAFFDALAATSRTAHLVQMLDSTIVRAHVSAAGAKGGRMVKRWAARAGASRPSCTCAAMATACRSRSSSPPARRTRPASSTRWSRTWRRARAA